MGKFDGKTVFITGGTRGIGRAIAEAFKKEGASVAVTYVSRDDKAKELDNMGIMAIKCDVSKRDEVRNAVEQVQTKLGDINILVNNAGVEYDMPFEEYNEELFDKMLNVNLKGIIYTVLEALPQLKKTKGVIINIASIAALGTALKGTTFYAITKSGVITLTRRLAFELSEYGIRVNAVAPGWIETDLTLSGRSPDIVEKTKSYIRSKTMAKSTGLPQDVANAVLFLASDEARYITGQILVVDGGRIDYLTHGI